ncbi:uncharacterized protein LOC120332769 [Styela clava]
MSNRSSCDNFVTVKTSPYPSSNGSRMIPLLTPPRKRIKMDFCPRDNSIWTVRSLIDRFNAPESKGASNSKEKSAISTRVDCLQKNQLQQQFSTEVEFKNLHGPPAERTETTRLESTVVNIEVRDRVVSLVNKCEVEKVSSDEIISDIHKDKYLVKYLKKKRTLDVDIRKFTWIRKNAREKHKKNSTLLILQELDLTRLTLM